MKKTNNRLNLVTLSLCLSTCATVSAQSAGVAPSVPISPLVSTGSIGGTTEKQANIWFLLDDSKSMRNFTEGFMPFDPSKTYELPKKLDGTAFKLPKDKLKYYFDDPWKNRGKRPKDQKPPDGPFYAHAAGKADEELQTHLLTDRLDDLIPNNKRERDAIKADTFLSACGYTLSDSQEKLDQCRIWISFYSTRLLTLKSTISLVFFDEKNQKQLENLRIGYRTYYNKYGNGSKSHVLPVMPLYGDDGEKNKRAFLKAMFSLHLSTSTPIRGAYAELVRDITLASRDKKAINTDSKYTNDEMLKSYYWGVRDVRIESDKTINPFLVHPGEAPSDDNPILTCRRNHIFLLTDGEWKDANSQPVGHLLATGEVIKKDTHNYADSFWNILSPNGGHPGRRPQHIVFPDGKVYHPIAPYTSERHPLTQGTVADLAFTAWATDLDGKPENNDLIMTPALKKGEKRKEHNGEAYWHPHNDPANWQHISTHTVGYRLVNAGFKLNPVMDGKYLADINAKHWNIDLHSKFRRGRLTILPVWIKKENAAQDFANAALAGRGRYYDARTADDLRTAFNDLLTQAEPPKIMSGTQGASGTVGGSQTRDNAHYSTRYNEGNETIPPGGELIKSPLFDGLASSQDKCFGTTKPDNPQYGTLCTVSQWNAAVELSKPDGWKNRNIISLKRKNNGVDFTVSDSVSTVDANKISYSPIDFDLSGLSPLLKNRLLTGSTLKAGDLGAANDDDFLKILINYIKGDESYEIGKDVTLPSGTISGMLRNRNNYPYKGASASGTVSNNRNVLGVIMRSSPVFSGIPHISELHAKKTHRSFMNFVERYVWLNDGEKICQADGTDCVNACDNDTQCKTPESPYSYIPPVDIKNANLIFVGANDGMLHAFRHNDGGEAFAYLPNAVYDKLPQLLTEGKVSLVDGNITIEAIDLKDGILDKWQRFLTATMGGGAKGLFALDVTDPVNADGSVKEDVALWEYSNIESETYQKSQLKKKFGAGTAEFDAAVSTIRSNVGNIMAKPSVVQLSDGTWAVVVGNGYNSLSNKAALIVINAETGKTIQELVLENNEDGYTDSSKANGLGPAYFVAYPGKDRQHAAYVDRAYAGDLQGNLWVFDFTEATVDGGIKVVKRNLSDRQKPLFTATYTKAGKKIRQPITVAPLVRVHPKKYGYIVHFGTGALFDEKDLSSEVNNSIYAIWDDWVPEANGGLTNSREGSVIDRGQLNPVKYKKLNGDKVTTNSDNQSTVRELAEMNSGSIIDDTKNNPTSWMYTATVGEHRGWLVDLLPSERAWQPAFEDYGTNNVISISYNTVRYAETEEANSCEESSSSVQSWRLAFNGEDATKHLPFFGTIDLDNDSKINAGDLIKADTDNPVTLAVSGKLKQGVVSYNGASKSISTAEVDTISSPEVSKSESRFCNYLVSFEEDSKGKPTSREICRKSHNASWRQIVE